MGDQAEIEPKLREWDYGDYEGLTTPQILAGNPQWSLWRGMARRAANPSNRPGRGRMR